MIESLLYSVDREELSYPGATLTLSDRLEPQGFQVGAHEVELPEGVDYDLILTNAGEGILVTGMVRARAVCPCDRCLDLANLDLTSEVDEYYLFEEPEDVSENDDDVDYSLVVNDHIDLMRAIKTSLVMEIPFVVLCSEDCRGLCPSCGTNLNHESCDCHVKREEEKILSGPFAKLSSLKIDE